jgi:hypothetical protein
MRNVTFLRFPRSSKKSVREHQFAGRAVLPGDGVPGLDFVCGDLDVAPFHGSVEVGALPVFYFVLNSILFWQKKKQSGAGLGRFPEGKKRAHGH